MSFERVLPGLAASPDVHPVFVHFPIAFFPLALALWSLSVWRYPRFGPFARLLVFLGTASALVAAGTGLIAQELIPHGPRSVVAPHRLLMILTCVLAVAASTALVLTRKSPGGGPRLIVLAVLGALNAVLLPGADRGALVALRLRADLAAAGGASSAVTPGRPSGSSTGMPTSAASATADGDPARGNALYKQLRCGSCHDAGAPAESPGIPPDLGAAGSRYSQAWMAAYLEHPYRIHWADEDVRPVVRMPDFGLSPQEAADLAAALAARRDTVRFSEDPVAAPFTEVEVSRGKALANEYTCRGCHVLEGAGKRLGPELDGAGARLRPPYVYAFLMKPKEIIPGTPMKDLGLWEEEARSLTAYLTSLRRTGAVEESASGGPR